MSPDAGKFRVLTANGDGTSELDVCGWTHVGIPDGRRLVARRQTNRYFNPWCRTVHWVVIQIQDVASGQVKTLSRFNNVQLNDLAWLPGSRGLSPPINRTRHSMRAVKSRSYLSPPASFAPSPETRTTIRRLLFRRMEKHLLRFEQKATQTFYLLPAAGFTGNPPNPAPAQIKDAIFFDWARNGILYFDDVDSLVRISADGADKVSARE